MEKTLMLDLNKEKWKQTDKSVEEFEDDYIRIIRPINDEVISIDCPECKNLLVFGKNNTTLCSKKDCKYNKISY